MKTELLTTLKRKATEIIESLSNDREPILITNRGKPSAYLIDVITFDKMKERLEILEGIARGEKVILEDRSLSQSQAKKKISRWLK